jgi:chitin disaccharide deacetylase
VKTAGKKQLIVNADDFGQSPGVNRGIIEAHEDGIVTSASLMVRWPAAAEAAAYSRERAKLSLGIHVDLGEWSYQEGNWVPLYEVVPMNDGEAVKKEVYKQLATFRRLMGRDPSHIDSHQHVHLRGPARSLLVDLARDLHVPLRHCSPRVRYCGNFYGQTTDGSPLPDAIGVEALLKTLTTLPPGLTELGCHPGEGNDLDTMYGSEREREVKTLCDPRVRDTIDAEDIELCSFHKLVPNGTERRPSLPLWIGLIL